MKHFLITTVCGVLTINNKSIISVNQLKFRIEIKFKKISKDKETNVLTG